MRPAIRLILLIMMLPFLIVSRTQADFGVWTSQGSVISGDPTDDESNVQEPNVLYEGDAQILTGTVYKMWLKGGWNTSHINYYESYDGISWTPYGSNPLITGGTEQPHIFKDGATYYLYFRVGFEGYAFKRYSSSDGVNWTLDSASTLGVGGVGAWDHFSLGNIFVWKEGASDWRAIYEALNASGGTWKLGYATSSDGLTWSKSGSNPVIAETGSTGGPFIYKDLGGTYWMWVHHSPTGSLPTDLERYYSTDLITWTRKPTRNTLWRVGSGEGAGTSVGQIADPTMLEINGKLYMWLGTNPDGSGPDGHGTISLKTADMTFEQIIHSNEGY